MKTDLDMRYMGRPGQHLNLLPKAQPRPWRRFLPRIERNARRITCK
jgi:hypothetical protein